MRILVVEDEEAIAEALAHILTKINIWWIPVIMVKTVMITLFQESTIL